jgi:hypothetical protein
MSEEDTPTPVLAAKEFAELAASAAHLNAASDEFSRAIAPLEHALHHLNIGVECWVRVNTYEDPDRSFTIHELGYARIGRKWAIALRVVTGNENYPLEDNEDKWAFNEGPRHLRVDAIEKIPELLGRLKEKAESMTKKIKLRTETARAIGKAVHEAADGTKKKHPVPVTPKKSLVADTPIGDPQ